MQAELKEKAELKRKQNSRETLEKSPDYMQAEPKRNSKGNHLTTCKQNSRETLEKSPDYMQAELKRNS